MRRIIAGRVGNLVTAIAIAVAVLAASGCASGQKTPPRAASVAAQAAGATVTAPGAPAAATELQPVKTSDRVAPAPGEGVPVPTPPPVGGREPPNLPPLEGRTSETSLPRDSATAGPPVSYTDPADDAYGLAGHSALSQPAFDILLVRWAPASEVDQQLRGYSSSITVAGAARNDGAYVTYGDFPSDVPGERCQLYNILTPGSTAFANAFCGTIDEGTRRFIGSVQGGQVTSTRTAGGGTQLIATFDDSALPRLLEAGGRMLFRLSAFTCVADLNGPAAGLRCGFGDVLDEANTFNSYRL